MSDNATSPAVTAVAKTDAPIRTFTFRFSGDGGEFFKIWIVNLLLTVVTLGIYSLLIPSFFRSNNTQSSGE